MPAKPISNLISPATAPKLAILHTQMRTSQPKRCVNVPGVLVLVVSFIRGTHLVFCREIRSKTMLNSTKLWG